MSNNKENNPLKRLSDIAKAFKEFSLTIDKNTVCIGHKDFDVTISFKNPKIFTVLAKWLISNVSFITDLMELIEKTKKESGD